jgi:CRP/FNR family transcriptional regulator, cyclic AMP receptor protein
MDLTTNGRGPEQPPSIFELAERSARNMSLVDLDPELFEGVGPRELARVRETGAHVLELDGGLWQPQFNLPAAGLGLLVVDGVLVRTVHLGDEEVATELVGPGDIIRPWEAGRDEGAMVPVTVGWFVLQPTRLAVLGRTVARAAAECPGLVATLVERTARRSRSQGILTTIAHMKRIDVRVLLLLWHLAERWGRVTAKGVVVPMRLTHQRLALLVGAQRPSVTAALSRMTARGLVGRTQGRDYVLTNESYAQLQLLCDEGERAVSPIIAA